jgi:hypothetical protein
MPVCDQCGGYAVPESPNSCGEQELPEGLWQFLLKLPAFRYLKAPVAHPSELYEKYPKGSESGALAFVTHLNNFWRYLPRKRIWTPVGSHTAFEVWVKIPGNEGKTETDFVAWLKDGAALLLEAWLEQHLPCVGSNENWYLWNEAAHDYVDSGLPSRGPQGDQGVQGPQGEDAVANVNYRGPWEPGTFNRQDVAIASDGHSYIVVVDSTVQEPADDASDWRLFVMQGPKGDKGDAGVGISLKKTASFSIYYTDLSIDTPGYFRAAIIDGDVTEDSFLLVNVSKETELAFVTAGGHAEAQPFDGGFYVFFDDPPNVATSVTLTYVIFNNL